MTVSDIKTTELFNLNRSIAGNILAGYEYPWLAVPKISEIITALGAQLSPDEYEKRGETVWVHKTAKLAPTAFIGENVIICANAEVRHCAFVRENAIIGANSVVGNSTELKNVILFDLVEVPHYNYVGDSVLGCHAHLGAGAVTSNVKSDRGEIVIHAGDCNIETGLLKLGAILADNAEIGCGSVLNPGTVIGKNTSVYPLSSVRGCIDADSIYKKQGEVAARKASQLYSANAE